MILDPFNPDKVKERSHLGFGAVNPSNQFLSSLLFSLPFLRKILFLNPPHQSAPGLPRATAGSTHPGQGLAQSGDIPRPELLSECLIRPATLHGLETGISGMHHIEKNEPGDSFVCLFLRGWAMLVFRPL